MRKTPPTTPRTMPTMTLVCCELETEICRRNMPSETFSERFGSGPAAPRSPSRAAGGGTPCGIYIHRDLRLGRS